MDRIDVIVPAQRAHETLGRTLESLAMQSIAGDLDVLVIDDACPEGDYHDAAAPFCLRLNIKIIRLPHNLGPGGARQAGIDASDDPYFTCIDADDAFIEPVSLELLRSVMIEKEAVQRCGGGLMLYGNSGDLLRQSRGVVSMDGKREASTNYGIESSGRIGMYVEERNCSWASRSPENDNLAVTIECANLPDGLLSDECWNSLVDLCADICIRNGITDCSYTGDTDGVLTMHRWFQDTVCPGPWLSEQFERLSREVNARIRS